MTLDDQIEVNPAEMELAEMMAQGLHKMYPGHLWAVNVSGTVVNIRNLALSGEFGYVLHLAKGTNRGRFLEQAAPSRR